MGAGEGTLARHGIFKLLSPLLSSFAGVAPAASPPACPLHVHCKRILHPVPTKRPKPVQVPSSMDGEGEGEMGEEERDGGQRGAEGLEDGWK